MIKMNEKHQVRLGDVVEAMDMFIDIKRAYEMGMDWVTTDFMLFNKNGEASISVNFLIEDGVLVSKRRYSRTVSLPKEGVNSQEYTKN